MATVSDVAATLTLMQPDVFALPAFVLSIVGLIIAVIAAMTGIASLSWQITTRRRGAHNVRVTTGMSLLDYGPAGVSDWLIGVTAANVGAAAVAVNGWGFELPSRRGNVHATAPVPGSTPLPHTLQPGTSMTVFMRPEQLAGVLAEQHPPVDAREVRAFVSLGTGERTPAKRRGAPSISA